MKLISVLIRELESILDEHGDLVVGLHTDDECCFVSVGSCDYESTDYESVEAVCVVDDVDGYIDDAPIGDLDVKKICVIG
jgi:hypothetical protein